MVSFSASPSLMRATPSDTFRVRATGKAGDVASTIDAVIRLEAPLPGVPVTTPTLGVPDTTPGRIVHWQEG